MTLQLIQQIRPVLLVSYIYIAHGTMQSVPRGKGGIYFEFRIAHVNVSRNCSRSCVRSPHVTSKPLSPAGHPRRESTCCHIAFPCAAQRAWNRRGTLSTLRWRNARCPLAGSYSGCDREAQLSGEGRSASWRLVKAPEAARLGR